MDKETVFSSFGKYLEPLHRLKLQEKLEQTNHDKIAVTTAKPSDRSQMEQLIDEEGATYVFDRGYLDYKKFDEFCANHIHFVNRLREDAVYYLLETKTSSSANIQSDSTVLLGSGQKQMKHPHRVVEVLDTQGKLIRIVTNHKDLSVEEISDL